MGQLSSIVVIALVLLISEKTRGDDLSEEQVPQIKVVNYQIWYINPNYMRNVFAKIRKHNDTYNSICASWEIIKDLPEDVSFEVKVYASDVDYSNGQLIYSNDIAGCTESPDRELLLQFILQPDEKLGGNCYKKGKYVFDDIGEFRFDLMIPNIENISDYYYIDTTMHSQDMPLANVTYYSEWGYLNAV